MEPSLIGTLWANTWLGCDPCPAGSYLSYSDCYWAIMAIDFPSCSRGTCVWQLAPATGPLDFWMLPSVAALFSPSFGQFNTLLLPCRLKVYSEALEKRHTVWVLRMGISCHFNLRPMLHCLGYKSDVVSLQLISVMLILMPTLTLCQLNNMMTCQKINHLQ